MDLDLPSLERIMSTWTFPTVVLFVFARWASKLALWAKPIVEGLVIAHHKTLEKLTESASKQAQLLGELEVIVETHHVQATSHGEKVIARVDAVERQIITTIQGIKNADRP
jgi:hypothetical protein